jgi:RNA polymerase sigma-70 factor, ECF subfamily
VSKFPSTAQHLLVSLADPANDREWSTFVRLYEPALVAWLRKRGLQLQDAEDCTQKVLMSVVRSLGTFRDDLEPAAFRRWLQRIARNELINHVRKAGTQPKSFDDSLVWNDIASKLLDAQAEDFDRDIELEYQRHLLQSAADHVRSTTQESTWQAFWRSMVLAQPTAIVARELGMSIGSVYVAKGRVLQRLQAAVKSLENPS